MAQKFQLSLQESTLLVMTNPAEPNQTLRHDVLTRDIEIQDLDECKRTRWKVIPNVIPKGLGEFDWNLTYKAVVEAAQSSLGWITPPWRFWRALADPLWIVSYQRRPVLRIINHNQIELFTYRFNTEAELEHFWVDGGKIEEAVSMHVLECLGLFGAG